MDWSLFPQLLFWSVLAILAFIGFIFMARLIAPDYHRQMFQVIQGWAARWRAWRDPEGERRRQLWRKYQEVQQYLHDLKLVEESIGQAKDGGDAAAKKLAKHFDMKAAHKLTEDETVPLFDGLTEADATVLAIHLKLTPEFKDFHVPAASIADFLVLEKWRIKDNRHLVREHLDRLGAFMREEEETWSRVSKVIEVNFGKK